MEMLILSVSVGSGQKPLRFASDHGSGCVPAGHFPVPRQFSAGQTRHFLNLERFFAGLAGKVLHFGRFSAVRTGH